MSTLDRPLRGATVVVCCGSGGVGKTTVAAVIGIELARRDLRVVVVTIDPARRLADALGLAGGLGAEPQRIDIDVAGELWAMMLDTEVMFDRVVRANAATAEQADRIVQNRFFRNMAGALSGTQEYMASEALHQLHGDARFDVVVVDTPPSRHALDFLEAPGVLARFLDHKVFKLLMLPTRSGLKVLNTAAQPILRAIGRVVGSDVLADAVAFFQAFAGMEVGFRDRASSVMSLLISPQTRYVLVAAPRHDTVAEAVWFADQLRARGIAVAAAVVNRVHPRFGSGTADDAAGRASRETAPALAALWTNLADLRMIGERERDAVAPLDDRLDGAPLVEVPLLAGDVHDLDGLVEIGTHLFKGARSVPTPGHR
jgi:anion-transporting  ArsA/GET3 family ATPase